MIIKGRLKKWILDLLQMVVIISAVDGCFLVILLKRVHSPLVLLYVAPTQSSLDVHNLQHSKALLANFVSISSPTKTVLPCTEHEQLPDVSFTKFRIMG